MYPETLKIMGQQEPYFRTEEFSECLLAIEKAFFDVLDAPAGSRFALLTGSGTAGMEAAVTNLFTQGKGKAVVINSGSFGARFVDICRHWNIDCLEVPVPFLSGDIDMGALEAMIDDQCVALFVQACETSSGRRFDLETLGEFCRNRHLLFVVDGVSAFLADEISMKRQNIDVFVTASQKALALAPDLAPIVCSPLAVKRIEEIRPVAPYYLDLSHYFLDQKRGQTPFTCAVSSVLALSARIADISEKGVSAEIAKHAVRAKGFRNNLDLLGVAVPPISLSNCCTPLVFENGGAQRVYKTLQKDYNIVLCPSGGFNADRILRVGHMGNLDNGDFEKLKVALEEVL